MYRRHSIWDEDKWDIHSSRSTYAGHSSGDDKSGYANNSSSGKEYHKNEVYGTIGKEENKLGNGYSSLSKQEDKDKENKEEGKGIVDRVEQEEKYQKSEEQEESKKDRSEFREMVWTENDEKPKEGNKSIEEAISNAVREEKSRVFVD